MTVREGRDRDPNVRPAGGDFRRGAPRRRAAPARRRRPRPPRRDGRRPGRRARAARVVALIPTGDELVPPGDDPGADQIVASNDFGLKALVEEAGGEARLLPIARDTPESLAAALRTRAEGADLDRHPRRRLGRRLRPRARTAVARGLALEFHRIAMRPGKPLMAGRLGGMPLVGLPGNPVSALVCAPPLPPPGDRADARPPRRPARARSRRASRRPRRRTARATHYMRARVEAGDGGWRCTPFARQDSSLLSCSPTPTPSSSAPPHDPAAQLRTTRSIHLVCNHSRLYARK